MGVGCVGISIRPFVRQCEDGVLEGEQVDSQLYYKADLPGL